MAEILSNTITAFSMSFSLIINCHVAILIVSTGLTNKLFYFINCFVRLTYTVCILLYKYTNHCLMWSEDVIIEDNNKILF